MKLKAIRIELAGRFFILADEERAGQGGFLRLAEFATKAGHGGFFSTEQTG